MDNIKELESKINVLKKTLSNPQLPEAQRVIMEKALTNANEKLKGMKDVDDSPNPRTIANRMLAELGKHEVSGSSFIRVKKTEAIAFGKKAFPKVDESHINEAAVIYVKSAVKISKKAKVKNTPAKTGSKPTPKPAAKIPDVKKAPKPSPAPKAAKYSWNRAEEVSGLEKIKFNCDQYRIKVSEDTDVILKGTGQGNVRVTAKKGESIIFNHKGYPTHIMLPDAFKSACSTVTAEKPVPTPAPIAKKPERKENPKPTPSKKPVIQQKPKAKRSICTLKDAETGRRLAKVIKFFIDNANDWHNGRSSMKITKIMRLKESGEIILEISDWRGTRNSFSAVFLGKRIYKKLCIDSFNLSIYPGHPKAKSFNIVVGKSEMKKVYTTKGEKVYLICVKTYSELLKCSFEGNCSPEQGAKWKELYRECGDLRKKLVENPKGIKAFHAEVKKLRKSNEKYSTAMSRVAKLIKSRFGK